MPDTVTAELADPQFHVSGGGYTVPPTYRPLTHAMRQAGATVVRAEWARGFGDAEEIAAAVYRAMEAAR